MKVRISKRADADITIYTPSPDKKAMFELPRYVIKSGEIIVEKGEVRRDRDHLKNSEGHGPGVRLAGVENVYFASVLVAAGRPAERCQLSASDRGGTPDDPHGTLLEARLVTGVRHQLVRADHLDGRSPRE